MDHLWPYLVKWFWFRCRSAALGHYSAIFEREHTAGLDIVLDTQSQEVTEVQHVDDVVDQVSVSVIQPSSFQTPLGKQNLPSR